MERPFQNSLLGQLKVLGFNEEINEDQNPLAIHIENFDIENSPFGNLHKKEAEDPIKKNETKKVLQKRLNDYDFNILQSSTFVDIEDLELSDDEKIVKIQNLIKEIDKKLFLIEEREHSQFKDKLLEDRKLLSEILEKLKTARKTTTMGEEIKKNLTSTTNIAFEKLKSVLPETGSLGAFLYRFFPKIYKGILMKRALKKLNGLNQTAKELMNKKIPYGESDQRYDALIEYLSSANTIHAKLIKKI